MLNRIEEFLGIYSEHTAAINFVIFSLLSFMITGFFTIHIYRGRKLRKALSVWFDLVEELNEKILTLSKQLSIARITLIGVRTELAESLENNEKKSKEIAELLTKIKNQSDES